MWNNQPYWLQFTFTKARFNPWENSVELIHTTNINCIYKYNNFKMSTKISILLSAKIFQYTTV
jgi:hypothetical protein